MRIFRFYSLTLVMLFAFLIIKAQKSKEVNGFIISMGNDTIACVFKPNSWKKQPREIKARLANKDTLLSAKNINGFFIPSLSIQYVSRLISLVDYSDNFQEASQWKDPNVFPAEKLFLKILHKGELSLYQYTDKLNRDDFFVETVDTLIQLYSHLYYKIESVHPYNPTKALLDKKYQYDLQKLMIHCRTLYSVIENIDLKKEHLLQLFDMYEKCIAENK